MAEANARTVMVSMALALAVAPIHAQSRVDTVERHAVWVNERPLQTFHGNGFTFQYPAGARIDSGKSHPYGIRGTVLIGPEYSMIAKWPANVDPDGRHGPAFKLLVSTVANPGRVPLARYVTQLVRKRNGDCTKDCENSALRTTFNGVEAWVVDPGCGDCSSSEVYFARGTEIVVFAFATDDNDMLDALTTPLYWLMLETFRWTAIRSSK